MKKIILCAALVLVPFLHGQQPAKKDSFIMRESRNDSLRESLFVPAGDAHKLEMSGPYGKHTVIKAFPVIAQSYDKTKKRLGLDLEVSGPIAFFSHASIEVRLDGVSRMIPLMPWKEDSGMMKAHSSVTIEDEQLVRKIGSAKEVWITVIADTDNGFNLHLSGRMDAEQIATTKSVVSEFDRTVVFQPVK